MSGLCLMGTPHPITSKPKRGTPHTTVLIEYYAMKKETTPKQPLLLQQHHHRRVAWKSALDDVSRTLRWWMILSTIAITNIGIWIYSYLVVTSNGAQIVTDTSISKRSSNRDDDSSSSHPYQRYHLALSGVYVFVCAYRSFLPRIDLERYCLFDTPLSSIFLGRLTATIAEVAFATQIALFLYHIAEVHHHPWTQCLALFLVPAIVIAQCFCWCGVVTLNHIYHAIEESIWALCSLFIGMAMLALARYQPDCCFRAGIAGMIFCILFFIFMVTVDVPMYVMRWREVRQSMMCSKEKKLIYMNSFDGSIDAIQRRVVTKSWKVWKEETWWLTLYFSTAVWLSLLLIHKSIQNW